MSRYCRFVIPFLCSDYEIFVQISSNIFKENKKIEFIVFSQSKTWHKSKYTKLQRLFLCNFSQLPFTVCNYRTWPRSGPSPLGKWVQTFCVVSSIEFIFIRTQQIHWLVGPLADLVCLVSDIKWSFTFNVNRILLLKDWSNEFPTTRQSIWLGCFSAFLGSSLFYFCLLWQPKKISIIIWQFMGPFKFENNFFTINRTCFTIQHFKQNF